MHKPSTARPNIIGGSEVGQAIPVNMDTQEIHQTNDRFWSTIGSERLGVTALPYYGAFISEENCQLLGDLTDKKVLEIGCGNGRSLQYVSQRGASELWGIDISATQIEKSGQYLDSLGINANLICSPMEADCGLPENYFNLVYSVYAIGWTTDLIHTFQRIASYLHKDGTFIFSWSHPIHKCVSNEAGELVFKKNYFDESWYTVTLEDERLSLADRKLSTYINALAQSGFMIEQLIEQSDENLLLDKDDAFAQKARMLPVSFVIKARKL